VTHWLVIWIGAFVTLITFSYLVKDNPVYRFVQHAALGVTVGIALVVAWYHVLKPLWWTPVLEAFEGTRAPAAGLWLLALAPGGMWYFQLSRKWFWISTLVSGLFIGTAAGLAFKGMILLILPQVAASIKVVNPWAHADGPGGQALLASLNGLVFTVGLLTTLLYFFFSVRTDNRLLRPPMRVGRVMIMVALGAMFGSTVMTRMAYLLDRLQFLYGTWLAPLFSG